MEDGDRLNPYLAPLSARSIKRGSFALLGCFTLGRCRYRLLPDDRFREIGVLPPTDATVVAQDTTRKPLRCFPPLHRLSSLARRAQHIASRLLYDRTFGIVVDHRRRRCFRLLVGGALFPDLGVDFFKLRAVGSMISQRF